MTKEEKTSIRMLYGNIRCMESEIKEAYTAIRRLEEWVRGTKTLLEKYLYNE